MKFDKTTYVIGDLIPKLKKDFSALIDADYYQGDGIDVGDNNKGNFAKFNNGTKELEYDYDYDDDKHNNMNTMNININTNVRMNIHFYNNHSHHNNHRITTCLK